MCAECQPTEQFVGWRPDMVGKPEGPALESSLPAKALHGTGPASRPQRRQRGRSTWMTVPEQQNRRKAGCFRSPCSHRLERTRMPASDTVPIGQGWQGRNKGDLSTILYPRQRGLKCIAYLCHFPTVFSIFT